MLRTQNTDNAVHAIRAAVSLTGRYLIIGPKPAGGNCNSVGKLPNQRTRLVENEKKTVVKSTIRKIARLIGAVSAEKNLRRNIGAFRLKIKGAPMRISVVAAAAIWYLSFTLDSVPHF